MDVDLVIIGGGIAGLWTLDEVLRHGYRAVLLENRALGTGQTIAAQGIIHGGLKYSLKGALTPSADEIREMPLVWRECLSGLREPILVRTDVRSHCCYLWQTQAFSSQAGMFGAQLNLRVKPTELEANQRPSLLRDTAGTVYRLNEQVISPGSLLNCFRGRLSPWLMKIDEQDGLEIRRKEDGTVQSVTVRANGREQTLNCRAVLMTAGSGNEKLSQSLGLKQPMQRRPLHMTMVRGHLPVFQGHCIDGAKTRITVTSEFRNDGSVVWQMGGNLAEQGTKLTSEELIRRAVRELKETLPALSLKGLEFATYCVDRAERKVKLGLRPDSPQILKHENVLTCWPTKMAFAPRVAIRVAQMVQKEWGTVEEKQTWKPSELAAWPKPGIAAAPWRRAACWVDSDGNEVPSAPLKKAA